MKSVDVFIKGNEFKKNPLSSLNEIDKKTCGFLHFSIDDTSCVYINDPTLISQVLASQWPNFRKEFGYKKSRDLIHKELFSPEITWPTSQEFINISSNLDLIINKFITENDTETIDLYEWCKALTMELFMQTLLKGSVRPEVSRSQLEYQTIKAIDILGNVILRFPDNIDIIDELELDKHSELLSYSQLFIQNEFCIHATPARAMTTILAGYEQMASIMFWLIVHYSKTPYKDFNNISNRYYLNEVIRLHSPIWAIMRRSKGDLTINEMELTKDSVVITSPWLMANNAVYFKEPNKFMPERWGQSIETYAFFPFSHGPRVCKGERFVRTAMYALLNKLKEMKNIECTNLEDLCSHTINVSAIPAKKVSFIFN
ncbi:cytochrome P450 [Iodobacter sp.]|uniref:cytochrome P450 n=1 Tax=Iodobacter sp. TaxID=1915058 RepID=UPI0025F44CB7|nr:cytochrome P450 [Iodobacter sp.]